MEPYPTWVERAGCPFCEHCPGDAPCSAAVGAPDEHRADCRGVGMVQDTWSTTRRSLMKGIAWAAPVATVAVAAPALAVSPPIVVTLAGTSCKETQGAKKYYLAFSIRNSGSGTAEVRATALSVPPNSGQTVTFTEGLPTPWESVGGHDTLLMDYTSTPNGNIANGTATATFEVSDPSGVVQTVTETFDVGSLPPCECVPAPCSDGQTPATTSSARTAEEPAPEDAPVADAVAEDAPAEESPAQESPAAEATPAETTAPAESEAPVEDAPVESTPGPSDGGGEPLVSDGGRG